MNSLKYFPLTKNRWNDFEQLFGQKGAYAGCWCMWWRLKRSDFEKQQGESNRLAMKAIVESGEVPGILAYSNKKAVGWCSVAPRENYASLNRSHVLKKIDDKVVWSLVCLFIDKKYRKQGITEFLIQSAIAYVKKNDGKIIEAYPTVPKSDNVPPVSSFMGLPVMFEKIGFIECAKPSKSKLVMRYFIDKSGN